MTPGQVILNQQETMADQIELGFPDLRNGFETGINLVSRGSLSKVKTALTFASITEGIPKRLIKEMNDGTYVNLDLFENGKYGSATLEKDRAVNSGVGGHGGSYYKLKIRVY